MVRALFVLCLLSSTALAQPVERWECDAARNRLIRLARPFLSAEQRILYRMKVDQRGSGAPIFCSAQKPEMTCLYAAKSYGEGRRCFATTIVELPVPAERENDPVAGMEIVPFPPKENLGALASAKTYRLVVSDASDSSAASMKIPGKLAAILRPVGLTPAKQGDVTIEIELRGTGIGLPYENLSTRKISTKYTAAILEGRLRIEAEGTTIAERTFDVETAPLANMDYQDKPLARPSDAPFADLTGDREGPYGLLLDLILASRGPAAHFAIIADKKAPFPLRYGATHRIEFPHPSLAEALRAAVKDKRPAVRDAVKLGLSRIK